MEYGRSVSTTGNAVRMTSDEPRDKLPGRGHRWPKVTPFRILLLLVAAYGAVALTMSLLRLWELQSDTWDLGIYQQSLWSTTHGHPFFEAPDLETGGFFTFLEVHSSFVLYLLVPVYAEFPSAVTLFVVQTVIVAAAAIPLYFLALDLTGSPRRGLFVGGLYLVWAPILAGNLFDFHVESFLPLEFFVLAVLWNRRRYALGFGMAALAFLTLEVAPVLAVFFALFFLVRSQTPADPSRASSASSRTPGTWRARLRALVTDRDQRAAIALIGASIATYYLLLFVRMHLLELAFHLPPFPPPTGYVIGATPQELGLSWQDLTLDFQSKTTYWVLLYALVGFVPLLDRRTVILVAPWVAFTYLTWIPHYSVIGNQDGFIAAVPMMIGVAFGSIRIPGALSALRAFMVGEPNRSMSSSGGASPPERGSSLDMRPHARAPIWLVPLVTIVALNLVLSPLNPYLHVPGTGGGYSVGYNVPPGFPAIQQLAGRIPAGASVIASDDLFPFVANDPNAYSLFTSPTNQLYLPFNSSVLPSYIFLAQGRLANAPIWIGLAVYNATEYGLVGVAWSTPAGAALLFGRGFTGAAAFSGAPPELPLNYSATSFLTGLDGLVTADPTAPWSTVVSSVPGGLGLVWSGPSTSVPAGNLSAEVEVRAAPIPEGSPPSNSTIVLSLTLRAFGEPLLFQHAYTFAQLSRGNWVMVTVPLPSPLPLFGLQLLGTCDSPSAVVEIGYFAVVLAGAPTG
jgi:uncharacterized membrane protein